MLDINLIRENPDLVKKGIASKNSDPKLVDDFLALDDRWRTLTKEVDDLRSQRKKLSAEKKIEESKEIKGKIKANEEELKEIESERQKILYFLPNLPLDDVKVGKDESENQVVKSWGEIPQFGFTPKDHVELGETLDIIDIKTAGKVSGARFNYLKGEAVLLEFALVQYVFSVLTNEDILKEIAAGAGLDISTKTFVPVIPPVMIRPNVFTRMARLDPGQEEERFFIPKDDLYLIGSAEHTLGPIHMDEIIDESRLPLRYVGFSSSFRREAGSYGKDTRGILRVHQFDKIEIEAFTTPELSKKEQDFIVAIQEYLVQGLNLPYRVVEICTGDMGAPDARQIDIEIWVPSQNQYRETHTSDLVTDYQARRLNTKFRKKDGSVELVHMNDATAFAIGRTLIAIMENYQQEDGSILVPEVLQKYLNFDTIS